MDTFQKNVRNVIALSAAALAIVFSNPSFADDKGVIEADVDLLTVVNLLTPTAGQQNAVVKSLQDGLTNSMRHQEGFISATIHRSLDSEHVLVYAQWKSAEHLGNAVKLIEAGKAPNMAHVFAIAQPDYHPYEVISVHTTSSN